MAYQPQIKVPEQLKLEESKASKLVAMADSLGITDTRITEQARRQYQINKELIKKQEQDAESESKLVFNISGEIIKADKNLSQDQLIQVLSKAAL